MWNCRRGYNPNLPKNEIFVFGSNLGGFHGKGAALTAIKEYGAFYGKGRGSQGRAYAIPTKDTALRVLPLDAIKTFIEEFVAWAWDESDDLKFKITRIGCGLAGYSDKHIAPLFKNAPKNCIFDSRWKSYLGDGYEYFDFEE